MENFLEETIEILKEHNKTIDDILYIQGNDFRVENNKSFLKLMDVEYDSGYGVQEMPEDLLIIGDNWWLERHEYDGAEWWEYKELPKPLELIKDIHKNLLK